jgi:hypothetical protein
MAAPNESAPTLVDEKEDRVTSPAPSNDKLDQVEVQNAANDAKNATDTDDTATQTDKPAQLTPEMDYPTGFTFVALCAAAIVSVFLIALDQVRGLSPFFFWSPLLLLLLLLFATDPYSGFR